MTKSSKKSVTKKQPNVIKKFVKPGIPNFPGTKSSVNFKPNARFQSVNRGRR
jgi:hypothetical protein